MKKILKHITKFQILFGVIIGLSVYAAYDRWWPVIVHTGAANWSIEQNMISADISGIKLRSCPQIASTAVGYLVSKNINTKTQIKFSAIPGVETDGGRRPMLKEVPYKWTWTIPEKYKFNAEDKFYVFADLSYNCNAGIKTVTTPHFEIPSDKINQVNK